MASTWWNDKKSVKNIAPPPPGQSIKIHLHRKKLCAEMKKKGSISKTNIRGPDNRRQKLGGGPTTDGRTESSRMSEAAATACDAPLAPVNHIGAIKTPRGWKIFPVLSFFFCAGKRVEDFFFFWRAFFRTLCCKKKKRNIRGAGFSNFYWNFFFRRKRGNFSRAERRPFLLLKIFSRASLFSEESQITFWLIDGQQ